LKINMKKRFLFLSLLLIGAVFMWYTFFPQLIKVNVPVKNLPPSLEGVTILHLSDLHSARFGNGQKRIFNLLRNKRIDIIVITGDLIDFRRKKLEPGLELVERATELAPVYYVPGNHERASGLYEQLKEKLVTSKVHVLDNGTGLSYFTGNGFLTLIGVGLNGRVNADLSKLRAKGPVILLSHYPRVFNTYSGKGVDLILAGHTHGGQIRIPWIGALWVPGQGKFPKYDAGLFEQNGSYLYINRGLGTSGIPLRLFCRPEVTLVTLIGG